MYKNELSQFGGIMKNYHFDNTDFKKLVKTKKITFVESPPQSNNIGNNNQDEQINNMAHDEHFIIAKSIEIQQHLCELGNVINSYFQLQILIIILISFIIIVFDSYYILELFIGVEGMKSTFYKKFRYNIMATYLYQVGGYALNIIFIVYFCTTTMNTAKKTGRILHRILNRNLPSDLQFKIMLFSQQLVHSTFTFAPYGFFSLDGTLIYAVVGATTTYLVILLQFTTDSPPVEQCNVTKPTA